MMAEAIQDATMALKKALIERALGGELNHHLGYPPGGDKPAEAGNHRNGSTGKTALTEDGPLRIEVPRMVRGSERPRSPLSRFEGLVLAETEGFRSSAEIPINTASWSRLIQIYAPSHAPKSICFDPEVTTIAQETGRK